VRGVSAWAARALAATFVTALIGLAHGQEEGVPEAPDSVRFRAVDIYIDPANETLAAYQFELTANETQVKIVGVEGGDHPAFTEPPYHDPKALKSGRIVIAAFSTGEQLPDNRTRVARVHLMVSGDGEPDVTVKRIAFASASGQKISADVTLQTTKGGRL